MPPRLSQDPEAITELRLPLRDGPVVPPAIAAVKLDIGRAAITRESSRATLGSA
jgi:hypothetical protein